VLQGVHERLCISLHLKMKQYGIDSGQFKEF